MDDVTEVPANRSGKRRRGRGDDGFILVTFGLFLTAFMIVAALAVDVGGWYARGAQLQRAADAAALAGVVWMPNFPSTAQSVALTTAAKNGFTDGNSISVTAAVVPGNAHRLQVTITDGNAARYFSQFVIANETITKQAVAEYVMPLPLGSPKNTFGSGDIFTGTNKENMWAAVNGYCAARESGDLLLAHDDSTYFNSTYNCPGNSTNPEYDSQGYYYTIDVPSGASGSLNMWLFDPAFDGGRGDIDLKPTSSVTTTFKLYAPGPNTFNIPSGGSVLQTTTYASGSTTYLNSWVDFYNGTLTAGRYFLEVYTTASEANSFGSNGFAMQAIVGAGNPGNGTAGSGANACTTISGQTGYSATCAPVHGIENMSIYANLSGTQASFYLAQVDPVYAGKTLDIMLFDPGEGASSIEILDPNGNPATFTWTTPCNPPTAPSGGCSGGPTSLLDVSGSGFTQPVLNVSSTSKYSDRSVHLFVPLRTDYTAAYGSNVWWKVRYTVGSSPTDRTTWAATIQGNPVHLVQ